jgi:hypothetical protein
MPGLRRAKTVRLLVRNATFKIAFKNEMSSDEGLRLVIVIELRDGGRGVDRGSGIGVDRG